MGRTAERALGGVQNPATRSSPPCLFRFSCSLAALIASFSAVTWEACLSLGIVLATVLRAFQHSWRQSPSASAKTEITEDINWSTIWITLAEPRQALGSSNSLTKTEVKSYRAASSTQEMTASAATSAAPRTSSSSEVVRVERTGFRKFFSCL